MKRVLLGAAAVMMGAGTAGAQDVWEFNIAPYAWMAGIDGDLAPASGLPTQSVSLSFSDVLDDLEYGAFLFASARRDDWVLFFDASSVRTDSTGSVGGPNVDSIGVTSTTSNVMVAAGRTVARTVHTGSTPMPARGSGGWTTSSPSRPRRRRGPERRGSRPTRAGPIRLSAWLEPTFSTTSGACTASRNSAASASAPTLNGAPWRAPPTRSPTRSASRARGACCRSITSRTA